MGKLSKPAQLPSNSYRNVFLFERLYMLLLDEISEGKEFLSFMAEIGKVLPPSVSWLYLGQRIVISPQREVLAEITLTRPL